MASVADSRAHTNWRALAAWLPLAILPMTAAWIAADWPPWALMWSLAVSVYAGCKWLSLGDGIAAWRSSARRILGYLFLWPGMDARAFLAPARQVDRPGFAEWLAAAGKVLLGAILIGVAAPFVERSPTAAAWIGMAGIVLVLHFGLFHLLSIAWRRQGIDAPPIMNSPLLATSLADFWGRRWNLAFRDLASAHVFRPLAGRVGPAGATMAAFLVSGVVHDVVISLPPRGGYGLPTLYFAIHGAGLLFERSRLGLRLGTRRGITGRIFTAVVTLAPLCLLFHPTFIANVIVPMLEFIHFQW